MFGSSKSASARCPSAIVLKTGTSMNSVRLPPIAEITDTTIRQVRIVRARSWVVTYAQTHRPNAHR